jgi:hypothetical protein
MRLKWNRLFTLSYEGQSVFFWFLCRAAAKPKASSLYMQRKSDLVIILDPPRRTLNDEISFFACWSA